MDEKKQKNVALEVLELGIDNPIAISFEVPAYSSDFDHWSSHVAQLR